MDIKNGYVNKKYKIIYADPAWNYENSSLNRGGALRYYKTMKIDEIKALPVNKISDNNSILFMWVTFPMLKEGLETIRSWGFNYKTCGFVWVKTNKRTNPNQFSFLPSDNLDSFWGMGNWTRSNAEICLIGVKGKPARLNADVHQIIYSPIDKHSKKPMETRERIIRLCGDLPRIELFARQKIKGWDTWGNEIENDLNFKSYVENETKNFSAKP